MSRFNLNCIAFIFYLSLGVVCQVAPAADELCEGRNLTEDGKVLACEIADEKATCWTENKWFYEETRERYQFRNFCKIPARGPVSKLYVHNSSERRASYDFACAIDSQGLVCNSGERGQKIQALLPVSEPQEFVEHPRYETLCVMGSSDLRCVSHAPSSRFEPTNHMLPATSHRKVLNSLNSHACVLHDSEVTCYPWSKGHLKTFSANAVFAPQSLAAIKEFSIRQFEKDMGAGWSPRVRPFVEFIAIDGDEKYSRRLKRSFLLDSSGSGVNFENGLMPHRDYSSNGSFEVELIHGSGDAFSEVRDFGSRHNSEPKYSCGLRENRWICWGRSPEVPNTTKVQGPPIRDLRVYWLNHGTKCWEFDNGDVSCIDSKPRFSSEFNLPLPPSNFFPKGIYEVKGSGCLKAKDPISGLDREICFSKTSGIKARSVSIKILSPDLTEFDNVIGNETSGCGLYSGVRHCWGKDLVHFLPEAGYPDQENYLPSAFKSSHFEGMFTIGGNGCLVSSDNIRHCWGPVAPQLESIEDFSKSVHLGANTYCFLHKSSQVSCADGNPDDEYLLPNIDHLSGVADFQHLESNSSSPRSVVHEGFCLRMKNGPVEREVCARFNGTVKVELKSPKSKEMEIIAEIEDTTCGVFDGYVTCWNNEWTSRGYADASENLAFNFGIVPFVNSSIGIAEEKACYLLDGKVHCWKRGSGHLGFKEMPLESEPAYVSVDQWSRNFFCSAAVHPGHSAPVVECGLNSELDTKTRVFTDALGTQTGRCIKYSEESGALESCQSPGSGVSGQLLSRDGLGGAFYKDLAFMYQHDRLLAEDMLKIIRADILVDRFYSSILIFHQDVKIQLKVEEVDGYSTIFDPKIKIDIGDESFRLETASDPEHRKKFLKILVSLIKTGLPLLSEAERESASQLIADLAGQLEKPEDSLSNGLQSRLIEFTVTLNTNEYLRARYRLASEIIGALGAQD